MGERAAKPRLSWEGEKQVESYGNYLRHEQDLASDTVRNYLSDLRQFAAFCEAIWARGAPRGRTFGVPKAGCGWARSTSLFA